MFKQKCKRKAKTLVSKRQLYRRIANDVDNIITSINSQSLPSKTNKTTLVNDTGISNANSQARSSPSDFSSYTYENYSFTYSTSSNSDLSLNDISQHSEMNIHNNENREGDGDHSLTDKLRNWVVHTPTMPHSAVTSLLKILNTYHAELPLDELALLQQNGFLYNGIDYQVKTRCFICDAPARAFLKCIKSHGGYSSCEKCTDPGKYLGPGRVILENVNAELRTDESFRLQKDSDHHKEEITPLLQLNIGLVTSFPIDYMHNVCLGVTRKIINCWISGKYKTRLSFRQIANLSERMLKTKHCIPIEINRKPRSLNELARFKATEFRTFVLYLAPFVLPGIVDKAVYHHFLLLHVSITILCSNQHIRRFGCQHVPQCYQCHLQNNLKKLDTKTVYLQYITFARQTAIV
ncbi:hypothetical protein PPYR_00113 [Photinus pyralis]|uniref:Uncharacterized protein n=1 Tax=Photinus pyralis TaxID=7054 RepID=A0A5N4B0R1_PHOPY|nr:hypothetical protein PPYR_00113 [Photinus pyralis]